VAVGAHRREYRDRAASSLPFGLAPINLGDLLGLFLRLGLGDDPGFLAGQIKPRDAGLDRR
jgi:hypothetical protein